MMQTTNFLTQIAGAAAAPARTQPAASQDRGPGFSQTFSQTMSQTAQRQAAPSPAAAGAPKQAGQSAPKQQADKAAARPNNEAAKPAQAASSAAPKTDTTAKADSAKATDAERDAAAAAEAAASAPVVDMLALVASLNQPVAAPVAAAAEGGATPDDGAAQSLAAIDAQGLTTEQLPLEQDGDAQGQGQQRQRAGAELQADDGTQGGRLPGADALASDGADAANATASARFRLPEMPAPLQPQAAPAMAAVQQSSMAQAVANAAGDQLSARVGTEDWDDQVGQKIIWMVGGKEQSASLTLNPPDLGPVQVVLNVNNDHADVTFSSAEPEVRQALEDALPRLREMMSESGLSLGNASVNAGMPEQRQANMGNGNKGGKGGDGSGQGDGAAADNGSAAALEERAAARSVRSGTVRSLVDTYI